jgi:hypothetical protein
MGGLRRETPASLACTKIASSRINVSKKTQNIEEGTKSYQLIGYFVVGAESSGV